jgi:hypothetical protein
MTGLYEPYEGGGNPFYFNMGNGLQANTFPSGFTYHLIGVFSDTLTGINSGNSAKPYWDDYTMPDALTFTPGSGFAVGGGFDPAEGVYSIQAGAPQTQFTLHGQALPRIDPIFKLFNYTAPAPATITVDGVTKQIGQQYNAIKLSSSTLLIQYFATVSTNSLFTIPQAGGSLVISSVTVSNIGPSSATVTWMTNQPADSEVFYGTSTAYGLTASSPTPAMTHNIVLSDLTPNTLYHFEPYSSMGSGSASSSDIVFTTLASSSTSASFVRTDSTTQGNWRTVYGTDGGWINQDMQNLPAYAQVTIPTSTLQFVWTNSTTDVRALQNGAGTDRIASCWTIAFQQSGSFTVDINLTDGQAHQVAFYVLDWDWNGARQERIDITDAVTGASLDSKMVTNYQNGQYWIWNIQGHVKATFTNIGAPDSPNSVLSGLFFGPAS